MIKKTEYLGEYIEESETKGEQRKDGAWPHHAIANVLSPNRWIIIYGTRGFHGHYSGMRNGDNDRSMLYQIRADNPQGKILKEGVLGMYSETWDPLQDGSKHLKQHSHMYCFGVPKGALINGNRVQHENVFFACWCRLARAKSAPGKDLMSIEDEAELVHKTFIIECIQFRLNDEENDIEILQPIKQLRQKGYESGELICPISPYTPMNLTFGKVQAYNQLKSEWATIHHFSSGLAPVRFSFNREKGIYEWVETGELFANLGNIQLIEASLIPDNGEWVVATRTNALKNSMDNNQVGFAYREATTEVPGTAWFKIKRLFKKWPEPVFAGPKSKTPTSVYLCPDGIVRIFTNDHFDSHGSQRNPLYVWDVDIANGFELKNRKTLFDGTTQGYLPRPESRPNVDFFRLFPTMSPNSQDFSFRVKMRCRLPNESDMTMINDEEKRLSQLLSGRIYYDTNIEPEWKF